MRVLARENLISILRDASVVVIVSLVATIALNALRWDDERLDWIAEKEYEILVPCPEPLEEIDATSLAEALGLLDNPGTLFIDAREVEAFEVWHAGEAMNVAFDYLAPTPQCIIRQIIRGGAKRVLVYGDGDDPDSGHELGRELAANGLRNITYVVGGAPALEKALKSGAPGAPEGGAP
jgi:rhodanese-like protein